MSLTAPAGASPASIHFVSFESGGGRCVFGPFPSEREARLRCSDRKGANGRMGNLCPVNCSFTRLWLVSAADGAGRAPFHGPFIRFRDAREFAASRLGASIHEISREGRSVVMDGNPAYLPEPAL